MKIDPPRPLSSSERLMLDLLLRPDFAGVQQLRLQAETAVVVGRCDCGCPTVDLMVDVDARPAALASRLVPSEAEVAPVGDEPPGQIILFADDGRLSSLEYVYFDKPPTSWPDASRVRVIAPSA